MTQRFVNIFDRKDICSGIDVNKLPPEHLIEWSQHVLTSQKTIMKWKGNGLMKTHLSQAMYLQLLQELKPKTIIEFGTWQGGSAQWFYDMCKAIGFTSTVHTFAHKNEIQSPLSSDIQFHIMDNYEVDSYSIPFNEVEHPVLMIDDAHRNCINVLKKFIHLLKTDDYLILEDTHYFLLGLECKYNHELKTFINEQDFLVDSQYCDMFGYNMTDCLNTILRKS